MKTTHNGRLEAFADSVWTATTPVRFAGIWFPHVMSVIRLSNSEVVLHSPCRLSTPLIDDIAQLGKVTHIIAPNWFHDLYLAEYRDAYLDATLWGPPTLQRRLGCAMIDSVLNQTTRPPWMEEMPHFTLSGLLTFEESIFFHKQSKTLIVADLLSNVSGVGAPPLTRFAYRVSGIESRLGMLPYLRWFGFTSRDSLTAAAQTIGEWNPERLIVGHGDPIATGACERLSEALAYRCAGA